MDRLAALEAEVKADADAQRARKAAAAAKLRDRRSQIAGAGDQRVTRVASDEPAVRNRATDEPRRRTRVRDDDEPGELEHLSSGGDLGGALELASKANRVKQELTRPRGKGDKSWLASGVASLFLGPVGWLYAGSMREAVPAAAAYVALGVIATKLLPMLLLWPVMMVVMPLSGIAGVVYALSYNRAGRRQRLFSDKEKSRRALPTPRAGARDELRDET